MEDMPVKEAPWSLLAPTWVLIGVGTLGVFGVWNSLRSEQHQL